MTLPRFTDVPEGNGPAPGAGVPGAGNAEDFKRLILPHIDGAYNLARFITRDEELCQDVVQDAMLSAYRALGQFRGGSERSWLFTIVRNCARSAVTNKRKFAALTVFEGNLPAEIAEEMHGTPDPGPTPEEDFATKSDVEHVRRAIEAMPEPFREVVVLRDLEELAYAEIAQVTGVPIGTVMSRLSRGRAMLAKVLFPAAGKDETRSSNNECLR